MNKMIQNKRFRVFGPKKSGLTHFHAPLYQRGEGDLNPVLSI